MQIKFLVLFGNPKLEVLIERIRKLDVFITGESLVALMEDNPRLLEVSALRARVTQEQEILILWKKFVRDCWSIKPPDVAALRLRLRTPADGDTFLYHHFDSKIPFETYWKFAKSLCSAQGKKFVVDQFIFVGDEQKVPDRFLKRREFWSEIFDFLPSKLTVREVIQIESSHPFLGDLPNGTCGLAIALLKDGVCDHPDALVQAILELNEKDHYWGHYWLVEATTNDLLGLPSKIIDMLCTCREPENRARMNWPVSLFERATRLMSRIRSGEAMHALFVVEEAEACGVKATDDVAAVILYCLNEKNLSLAKRAAALAERSLTAGEVDMLANSALREFVERHGNGALGNAAKQIGKIEALRSEGCSPEMVERIDLVLSFYRSEISVRDSANT